MRYIAKTTKGDHLIKFTDAEFDELKIVMRAGELVDEYDHLHDGDMQHLLDAINTLSIHFKLKFAGIEDKEREDVVKDAKEKLSKFLKFLDTVVKEVERGETKPLIGVDPRLGQLTRNFVAAKKKKNQYRSDLFRKSPILVIKLLQATKPEDQRALIKSLAELRTTWWETI